MARTSTGKQELIVGGRRIAVSNPDKLMYPGFTKAQVIDFYIRLAPFILPHLHDRPVTMKRYPDGVSGEYFYEKEAPRFTPPWVKTFPVPRGGSRPAINYIVINDAPTLAWTANLANLEIHPFLHRVPDLTRPTLLVFDLDPGEGADLITCAEVALLVRDLLARLDLQIFPKVSGSKGMQLHVPLNTPVTYEQTQPFAQTVAQWLEQQHPKLIVSEMAKTKRTGKVFIDWSQNADFKTTVAVYSLRAKRERPFVSMPVTWEELEQALKKKDRDSLYFEAEAALKRLQKVGDLFAPALRLKQKLPDAFRQAVASPQQGRKAAKQTRTPAKQPLKSSPGSLKTYAEKRDFAKTPEPAPARRSRQKAGAPRFVIQKHAASHLHYDFRLEMEDVLKSWAVPKGPPTELKEKRLAMATEDHPIEYLDFEGTIPKGQYGGGTVMVWDIGTYELLDGNYRAGKLHVRLNGKKLKGEWALVKTHQGEKSWLLIKTGESVPKIPPAKEDASALTRRSMARIAKDNDAQWDSSRPAS